MSSLGTNSIDFWIHFFTTPELNALQTLERHLLAISHRHERYNQSLRLWISHMPNQRRRTFMDAQAFDLSVSSTPLTAQQREAFEVATGASPQRIMQCRSHGTTSEHLRLLLEICIEIMQRSGGMITLSEEDGDTLESMLGRKDADACSLATLPGKVYELAYEHEEDELKVFHLLDKRALLAWYKCFTPEGERVSSDLPYSQRVSGLDY